MQKYIKLILITIFLCFSNSLVFADASIQKVEIAPLTGGVSFNTITFADRSITGWVTCPSVELIGRKQLIIINTHATDSVRLTGVSGSTATGTLKAGENATFKASSGLHVYVSANSAVNVECWEIR